MASLLYVNVKTALEAENARLRCGDHAKMLAEKKP
jgi:hypothetical protein